MYFRRVIYFFLGLVISCISLWGFAMHGYGASSDMFSLTPLPSDTTAHFIQITDNTIVQRNRFSSPIGVSVRQPVIIPLDNIAPRDTPSEFIYNSLGRSLGLPVFEHVNVNEHYIGRLEIPALSISEAVYFSGDDFYLRRDWQGRPSNAGELYIDGRSTGNLFRLDNLINGHSMNTGRRFGRLHNLRNVEGPVFIFINEYTTGRTFIYEIFAARVVRAQDTGVHLNFSSAFVRNQYYQTQIDNSFFNGDLDIDLSGPVLTLNTCDNSLRDGHLLVFAALIGWE